MRLYAGNLPYSTSEVELEALFAAHGTVTKALVITDKDSGRSKGFGFVEIDDEGGEAAMRELNRSEYGGRQLVVNLARERPDRR